MRTLCTRKKSGVRRLKLQPQAQQVSLQQARQHHASKEGKKLYRRRAGIEGAFSQAVRSFDLRHTRYSATQLSTHKTPLPLRGLVLK
jgi:hypothetical protein